VLHKLPPGARGLAGIRGPAGPAGAPGTAGTNGKNGTNGKDGKNGTNGATKVVVVSRTVVVGPNTDYPFGVACAAGSLATGGGFTGLIQASVKVAVSAPRFSPVDGKPFGWDIRVYNSGATNISATVYAVCAAP
jgi:hypothetical protein